MTEGATAPGRSTAGKRAWVALAATALLAGCGPVLLRPSSPPGVAVADGQLTLTAARLTPSRSLQLSMERSGRGEATVGLREVRLVRDSDPPCGETAPLALAPGYRQSGRWRWERPLPLANGDGVVLELPSFDDAFHEATALELDVDVAAGSGSPSAAGAPCSRLPLVTAATPATWQVAPLAPAVGARLYLDQDGAVVLGRVGLWTGRYRHGLELGAGRAWEQSRLGDGKVLAAALGSERIFSPRMGLIGVGAELSYQVKARWGARSVDAPDVVHGPRLGLRPSLVNVAPKLLDLGGRTGYFSMLELFLGLDLSAGSTRVLLGVGVTADRPLAPSLPGG